LSFSLHCQAMTGGLHLARLGVDLAERRPMPRLLGVIVSVRGQPDKRQETDMATTATSIAPVLQPRPPIAIELHGP